MLKPHGEKENGKFYNVNSPIYWVNAMKQIIYKTIFIFALVQLLAILIGLHFAVQGVSIVSDSQSVDNSLYFFGTIIVFAVLLLIILKYYKGKLLFLILELAMEFFAVQILASLFTSEEYALVIAAAVVVIRLLWDKIRQLLLLLTIAVVGALLGASLDVLPAALLAILLSGYDVIAVFYTKHMITLARSLTERGAAFTVKVTANKEKLELGTGDLVIPAMLIVSSNKIGKPLLFFNEFSISFSSIFALLFSAIGLIVLLWFLSKKKGYWPALPPIAIGAIVGALVGLLF